MTYIELGGGRPDSGQNVTETTRIPPANPCQKLLGDLPFAVTSFSGVGSRNEEWNGHKYRDTKIVAG